MNNNFKRLIWWIRFNRKIVIGLIILVSMTFVMAFIFNISDESPAIHATSYSDYTTDLKRSDKMAAKDDNISLNIDEEKNELIGETSSSITEIIEKYWPTILIGFATGIITVWISIPFHKCEEIVPGVRTYSCPWRESCEK